MIGFYGHVNGSNGITFPDLGTNSTNLHHGFVRVHELDGSVYSVYTALEIWWK